MRTPRPHPQHPRDGRRPVPTVVLFAAAILLLALSCTPVAAQDTTGGSHGRAQDAPSAPATPAATTAAKGSADRAPAAARTFAVQPTGAGGGPGGSDPRPYFSYSATPGATLVDHAAVHNYSPAPLKLTLYAASAFNTGDGGFDLETAGHTSPGVGVWTTLRPKPAGRTAAPPAPGSRPAPPAPLTVTVAARSTAVVAFRIAVPADATPGDHAGGIVASVATDSRDARGNHVTVDQRVGARVYLRVAGPLHPALTVADLHSAYQGSGNPVGAGRVTVGYTVRNTGNVQLSASQLLRASNLFGSYAPAHAPATVPLLLPGGSATFTERIDHVPPGGLSHVTLSLTAHPVAGQHDPALPKVRVRSSLWTVPWTLLALVAGAAAGALAWALRHRLRRARPDSGGPAPTTARPQSAS